MRKAGGIIAVFSGVLALGATFLTWLLEATHLTLGRGVLNVPESDLTEAGIVNGLQFSFLAIVLGAMLIVIGDRPARHRYPLVVLVLWEVGGRIPGLLLIAGGVQELYYNELGFVVLLFLTCAAIGGIVSLLPDFGAARRQDEA